MLIIEKKVAKKLVEDEKTKDLKEYSFTNYYINGVQIQASFKQDRKALNKILDFEISHQGK